MRVIESSQQHSKCIFAHAPISTHYCEPGCVQEPELEMVFDQLLCGSMENLFAEEKAYFASAFSSANSPRSSQSPHVPSTLQRPW